MVTNYLTNSEIDKKKWDNCIDNSINSFVYAKSWFLDIMCPGWSCIETDNYKAVFPLPLNKKYNIKYIYSPYFIQQLGLFFTNQRYSNEETFNKVINTIPSEIKFLSLFINEQNVNLVANYNTEKRINFILDLNKSYEKIYNNFSHGLKSNLKSAKKNDLEIIKSENSELIFDFYKKHTGERLNEFTVKDFTALKKLIFTSTEKNYSQIKLVYHKNELVSGAVFLFYNNRITYLLSSSSEKGKKLCAMPFLLNSIIQEYSNKSMIFDFEGSMVKGIAKFFRSFGSVESVYLQLKINRLPRVIRWLK